MTARLMLEFVGLAGRAHAEPNDLTLVDQRRVEIARALASAPKLLLLDEPAAGMNQNELVEFSVLVRSIRDKGLTILLVDHNMRLVMSVRRSYHRHERRLGYCGRRAARRPARSSRHCGLSGKQR